jgi:hypothetical protein
MYRPFMRSAKILARVVLPVDSGPVMAILILEMVKKWSIWGVN